jgi:porin
MSSSRLAAARRFNLLAPYRQQAGPNWRMRRLCFLSSVFDRRSKAVLDGRCALRRLMRTSLFGIFGLGITTLFAGSALAQQAPSTLAPAGEQLSPSEKGILPTPDYSGNIWSRPYLTGDWDGARSALAAKGLTLAIDVTQVLQGVVSGGTRAGWEYSGLGDLLFNLDTGKAGLWWGGILSVDAEGNWGDNVNPFTGAFAAVNSSATYPSLVPGTAAVPMVRYTQFISPHLGVMGGRLLPTRADVNAFAWGDGTNQFMNQALNFNPVLTIAPTSTLGGGIIIQPGEKPADAVISLVAIEAQGTPNTTGATNALDGGVIYSAESRVKVDLLEHTGHQSIGFAYSNATYSSLDQNPVGGAAAAVSGTWLFYYNFDQFLQETAPGSGKGWGLFGRFGASGGDPNKFKYFWSLGVGSVKGAVAARPNDTFGIGLYYSVISKSTEAALEGLTNEWGAEAYYDFAVTRWAQLSPDIQYVAGTHPVPPALVIGARLKLFF